MENQRQALLVGEAIRELRAVLGMTQEQLQVALGLKRQGNISAWEKGRQRPEGRFAGKLAELARQPRLEKQRALFLALVGMESDLGEELREVRVLKDAAAAGSPRQIEEREIEYRVRVPRELCPHPGEVVCVPVQGDSMAPLLHDGYVAAVDTAESDARALLKQMVMARDPDGGVTIKWLRRVNRMLALVPQNTSPRHEIREIEAEDIERWKLYRVLWWLGFPAKR